MEEKLYDEHRDLQNLVRSTTDGFSGQQRWKKGSNDQTGAVILPFLPSFSHSNYNNGQMVEMLTDPNTIRQIGDLSQILKNLACRVVLSKLLYIWEIKIQFNECHIYACLPLRTLPKFSKW